MSGSGSSGLRAWLVQRVSAAYLALYFAALLIGWLTQRPVSFEMWRGALAHPVINIATMLFFIALVMHVWVGMRDVALDYIQSMAWRLAALVVVAITLLVTLVWALRVLLLLPAL